MLLNSVFKFLVKYKQAHGPIAKTVCSGCSFSVYNRNRHRNKYENYRRFLTYTAVTGAITGYLWEYWNSGEIHIFRDTLRSFLPIAYAKSIDKNYRKDFNFIADIVEQTSNGVVNLEVLDQRHIDPLTGKPFVIGGGSGLIVEENGLILTNAHIVHKPNVRVIVKLFNGDVAEGLVEAIDERGDLATVRIHRNKLPTMKFGNSDDLRPGEFVVAMGSPLTLINSVTSGVVSNPGRHSYELRLFDVNMTYIQTDAAVTFGNSGGPLVNLDGEVVGINVLKFTPGISFAIPINYVKKFLKNVDEARKGNHFEGIRILMGNDKDPKRKFLGITMLTLTPSLLQTLREHGTVLPASVNHGILIWKVFRGSPAEGGGLKPGDIITHINDHVAVSTDDIYKVLQKADLVTLKLLRNGVEITVKIMPKDLN